VLAEAMRAAGPAHIHHSEDCLSARSMLALRAEGAIPHVVRTIHHVDAFTSDVLLECQRASIVDVDHRLCVSRHWADRVSDEFGVGAFVVANGVDAARYRESPLTRADAGRALGWGGRPVLLSVGGIEPRKGSRLLLEAFARARARFGDDALLAIAGGETLFDYREYRDAWRGDAERLGLVVHEGREVPTTANVVILGTVADDEMPALYRACDALAFPSTREGFGLVVLEALASSIPVVVTDLPVLREYLTNGRDCVMVPSGDSAALANALVNVMRDEELRERLRIGGDGTVARFTWEACAEEHERVYQRIVGDHG
jgi:glycosyltransferase-like protein